MKIIQIWQTGGQIFWNLLIGVTYCVQHIKKLIFNFGKETANIIETAAKGLKCLLLGQVIRLRRRGYDSSCCPSSSGLSIQQWVVHPPVGCPSISGLAIHQWVVHPPVGCPSTSGLSIHQWVVHPPAGLPPASRSIQLFQKAPSAPRYSPGSRKWCRISLNCTQKIQFKELLCYIYIFFIIWPEVCILSRYKI